MAFQTGDTAPAFKLYDSEKNEVSSTDYLGKKNLLILFYPLAFTGVCTKELCSVRDDINKYENGNTAVVGISVDSVYTLAHYKKEQSYNFPLLSDFNKVVSKMYDVLHESFGPMEMQGVSKRSAFVVDKTGILQYAEVLDNPGLMPDFSAIDRVIKDLS